MNSFIHLYSKFTEELLLLGAAALFSLLAIYCYEWVIKKRRLGAARNQVPAAMVKVYLNQLIDEAQFVRTQLFGLMNGGSAEGLTLRPSISTKEHEEGHESPAAQLMQAASALGGDLDERLKALQSQLTEKESIVVNINIEKTKLLEEIENLRQNQKAMQSASTGGGNSDELARKVKELEARLEEYSLFEDDLANLKRLQQENLQLRKKLEDLGSAVAPVAAAPTLTPVPDPAPAPVLVSEPAPAPATPAGQASSAGKGLDQSAIDALLEGRPATPPEPAPQEATATAAASPAPSASLNKDEFENLVASVETSLDRKPEPSASAPAAAPAPSANPADGQTPPSEAQVAKSDEELLKEFENLLNS